MTECCKHFGDSRKCDLLVKGRPTDAFFTIRNSFKQKHPNKEMVPNGDCFWDNDKMWECPYFEK